MTVGIGLVGDGGHQLSPATIEDCGVELRGVVGRYPDLRDDVRVHSEVKGLLEDPRVELVSVSLTPRSEQVDAAVAALDAGRHVLIERPAATSSADLARLRDAMHRSGRLLCERATTPFDQPYRRARELVADGVVGQVVLVLTHKSYPWADWREQDESIQGGLVLQSAGYGLDCVQHVAGEPVASVQVVDTTLGNPAGGALRMAATLVVTLQNGGVASVVVDYLNPPESGAWGRDHLVVLGTEGRLSIDAAARTVEVVRPGGAQLYDCPPSPTLLAELVAAITEDRTTEPSPEDLMSSTALVLEALERRSGHAGRVWFEGGRWRR
jgi:predicted dehydrogenase